MQLKKFLNYLGPGFDNFKLSYRENLGEIVSNTYSKNQIKEMKFYDNFKVLYMAPNPPQAYYIIYLKKPEK